MPVAEPLSVIVPAMPLKDGTLIARVLRSNTPPLAVSSPLPRARALPSCSVPASRSPAVIRVAGGEHQRAAADLGEGQRAGGALDDAREGAGGVVVAHGQRARGGGPGRRRRRGPRCWSTAR